MEFNCLDAQREACEAYVASQKAEGWVLVPDRYDDGGFLGRHAGAPCAEAAARRHRGAAGRRRGRLQDRPAQPLADGLRQAGRGVRPQQRHLRVSVTQSFNTTTSMGRLTLNILLSFAQFEREVIGERIRDKFAASRKKGMWMGGFVPLGYDVKDRKLVVNEAEAATRPDDLRALRRGSARRPSWRARSRPRASRQARQADRQGLPLPAAQQPGLHRRGRPQGHGLSRRAQGDHRPRRSGTRSTPSCRRARASARPTRRAQTPALLKGLIFGPTGCAMTPTPHAQGAASSTAITSRTDVLKRGADACPVGRVPAAEIESAVIDQVRGLLRAPEIIVRTWRAARRIDRRHQRGRGARGAGAASIRSGTNCSRPSRPASSSCSSSASTSRTTGSRSGSGSTASRALVEDFKSDREAA